MSKLIPKTFAEIYEINSSEYKEADIASLSFSVRIYNRFMEDGITTVKKILDSTPEKILSIKGFGKGCMNELYVFLDSLKEKVKNTKNNIKSVSVFKNHAESIAIGDFTFADEIEMSSKELELLDEYKRAFEVLGEEISFACVASPEKIVPIIEMFNSYVKEAERIAKLRILVDLLPEERKQKKAYGYINAFTLDDFQRKILKEMCLSTSDTLESMISSPLLKNDVHNNLLSKFLKWCVFDLYDEVEKLFSDLYTNKRERQVIIGRAKKYTLERIGTELNITRERVRQIEKKIKLKFARLHSRVRIISKISAERNGDSILTPSEIESYCGDYAQELLYLLQSYKGKNYFYDQQLDIFVIGDYSIREQAEDYIGTLPDMIKSEELKDIFAEAEELNAMSSEMIEKAFFDTYKLTGNVYHRYKLSLSGIYENILSRHFKNGLRIYDSNEIECFRKLVFEEYGDVGIPQNNRTLIARIIHSCVLCGRGFYKLKQSDYIPKELANKIYEYIDKSENSVFLTNTLFSVFEKELLAFGIDNKYYLQGVLHELYGDKLFFKRDYISKDANVTSIYSSIVEYIKKSNFPVSKEEIQKVFPGITEVVINFAVGDLNVLNYFGKYIHSGKINISYEEKNWLFSLVENMTSDNEVHHIKELYEKINMAGTDILTRNAALNTFSAFSIVEYLFCNDFQFSRPYIARIGVDIDRPNERLHNIISSSKEFSVSKIREFLKENHFQIQSILEFVNSCNDEFLLVDDDRMMRIEDIGITKENVQDIEKLIFDEITTTVPISELTSYGQFPKLSVPWSEWLLYSSLNKWGDILTVGTSFNKFRLSVPLVSPKGRFDANMYKDFDKNPTRSVVRIDNLDDIDSLLEDIIGEELFDEL